MPGYTTVAITSITEQAPGVKTFTIAAVDGSAIPYQPGQFITLVFSHHGREERRSFSISSGPDAGGPLSFTVKRVENGAYSRLLTDKARPGDLLQTTGAAGLFTLPPDITDVRQFFFFAAGIGITPVISLVRTILHTMPGRQVALIYSNRTREDAVFYDELTRLAAMFPYTFRIEFLYSTAFDLQRARLSKALMPVLLREYATAPPEATLYYVCGPFAYMRMAILALEEQGVPSARIRRENFNTNDRHVHKQEPPDKDEHRVTLRFNKQEYRFQVQYPDTILQAAKKQGIALPYSCETGRCGSCAAICTAGKVWLSYNEVLMDNDLRHGSILTCTGHPTGGDVEITA
jgi:ferredoxin-NADP reductase